MFGKVLDVILQTLVIYFPSDDETVSLVLEYEPASVQSINRDLKTTLKLMAIQIQACAPRRL